MCLVSRRREILGAESCKDNSRDPYSAESVRASCPFTARAAKITTGARLGLFGCYIRRKENKSSN